MVRPAVHTTNTLICITLQHNSPWRWRCIGTQGELRRLNGGSRRSKKGTRSAGADETTATTGTLVALTYHDCSLAYHPFCSTIIMLSKHAQLCHPSTHDGREKFSKTCIIRVLDTDVYYVYMVCISMFSISISPPT